MIKGGSYYVGARTRQPPTMKINFEMDLVVTSEWVCSIIPLS